MIVIGLTGGIAMGKSTVAGQFGRLGAYVISADAIVHALLAKGGAAVPAIRAMFPDAYQRGEIDRKRLGAHVFHDQAALNALERTLHPLVREEEEKRLRAARRRGYCLAVVEIPLLFETKAQGRVDITVAVTAPRHVQERRALARPHMTREKLTRILARQLMNHARIRKADYVIHTGLGKAYSFRQVQRIVKDVTCEKSRSIPKRPG